MTKSSERIKQAAERTKKLEAHAREQYLAAEAKADGLLRRIADHPWTIPAIFGIGLTILAVGIFIGRFIR